MPTLSAARPEAPAGDVIVFTSELPLRSRRFAISFLRDALRIRALLDEWLADPGSGLVRYELRAHPFANRYATASTWRSHADLQRFSAHPVHVAVMRRQAPHLGAARFDVREERDVR